ncbi:MAG TPA: rhomboid family intramembrane serine protease [Candidatus Angelobacter sp.]
MPQCLKCGADLAVNEEGIAPVLCDRCAGRATSRARSGLSAGTFRGVPATTALLAINIAAYIAGLLPGLNLGYWGTNFGPLTLGGEYWRLVTAGFLHAGFFHLAFNMWCLWSLGRLAERLFGHWQTAAIYLLTGVGGALLSIGYDPGRAEVGASGAIFGIAGAILAGLKFGNLAVSPGERRSVISSLIFFIIVNFSLGAGSFSFLGGNIDNMCHLGGFITGLLIGLPMGAFARHHKLYQLATVLVTTGLLFVAGRELVRTHGDAAQLYKAVKALRSGDLGTAIPALEKYTAANPNDDAALLDLGSAYVYTGQREKAIAAYEQALKANPESEPAKDALQALREDSPSKK